MKDHSHRDSPDLTLVRKHYVSVVARICEKGGRGQAAGMSFCDLSWSFWKAVHYSNNDACMIMISPSRPMVSDMNSRTQDKAILLSEQRSLILRFATKDDLGEGRGK